MTRLAKKGGITEEYSLVRRASEQTVFGRDRRASPSKRNEYNNVEGFQIGPLFDRIVFLDDRVYLRGDCGPYESSQEMLKAEIDRQLEWVRNGRLHSGGLLAEAGYSEDSFEEEAPIMERPLSCIFECAAADLPGSRAKARVHTAASRPERK